MRHNLNARWQNLSRRVTVPITQTGAQKQLYFKTSTALLAGTKCKTPMQTLPASAICFATRSSHGSICRCRVSAVKHHVLHIVQTCLCVLSECLRGSSCEMLFALKQRGPTCTPRPQYGPDAETCCCVCSVCCSNRRQRLSDN